MKQRISLIGHLGRDPEMRYTPGGSAVTNFSIATNRKWKNSDDEPQEETTWWRITCWGRLAEVTNEYLSKGRQVSVEGRMNQDAETGAPRIWTGDDGVARTSFEVTASEVLFLGGGGDRPSAGADDLPDAPSPSTDKDDEIPF